MDISALKFTVKIPGYFKATLRNLLEQKIEKCITIIYATLLTWCSGYI